MDATRQQLQRVLQLALHSPYEGERAKAVSLLLQRLHKEGLSLGDLDSAFQVAEADNVLKQRAGLPYEFEVVLKSREEALLFHGLLQRFDFTSTTWLEGHRLLCTASPATKRAAEELFSEHTDSLQARLAAAQQQAMSEYQQRRKLLFTQAVEDELRQLPS